MPLTWWWWHHPHVLHRCLAPSIGALVGIGAEILWRNRQQKSALLGVIATILVTILWSYVLLDRSASWLPCSR
nr:hypothetical protein [Bacilli bacterium]